MNTLVKIFTDLAISFSLFTHSTLAQIANTQEIEKIVRETDLSDFNPIIREMRRAYSDLLKNSPKERVRVIRDIAYGKNEANKLDLHQPETKSDSLKLVLVFIHGSGFVRDSKNSIDELLDNIGHYFARHGVVMVNADYRLTPKYKWPSGVEDMAFIVRWANKHIQKYGVDHRQIFLIWQSARA